MATTSHELPGTGGVGTTAARRIRHKHRHPSESQQQQSPLDTTTVLNGSTAVTGGGDPAPHHQRGRRSGVDSDEVASTIVVGVGYWWQIAAFRCVRALRSNVKAGKRCVLMLLGIALVATVVQFRNRTRTEAFLQGGWGGRPSAAGSDSDRARPSYPRVVSHYTAARKRGSGRIAGGDDLRFEQLDEPVSHLPASDGNKQVASLVGYDAYRKKGGRKIDFSQEERDYFINLRNSKRYRNRMRDQMDDGDCVPMHSWQEASFPSCNTVHELIEDATTLSFLMGGGYNDVFKVRVQDGVNGTTSYVLKVLKGPHNTEFSDRNFDTVRRDALIMERTTSSPYVMDIYAYCGFAQITTYSSEGDLFQAFWRWHRDAGIDRLSKLKLAAQVGMALAAIHDTDGDGRSAVSHGDFATKQYIKVGDVYKLNDFNRGRFIRWNKKHEKPCTYTLSHDAEGAWRSPEEYKREPLSSKIDIWALGSIFFEIATGSNVWSGFNETDAQQLLIKGKPPPVKDEIKNSTDPIDQVLLKAIGMCYIYDPEMRPYAKNISDFLNAEAKKLGVLVEATQF